MSGNSNEILKTVGLFTDSFPPMIDGVATVVKNYATQIQGLGIPVCVIAPSDKVIENEQFTVLRYRSRPLFLRKPYRYGIPLLNRNLYKQLEINNLGIIHAHSPFFAGKIALTIAKKNNIPIIASFHTKFKDNFEQIISSKFIVNQLIKKIISFYYQADEVWIPQASVEQTIREYGYKGQVEVVENGCDFSPPIDINIQKNSVREKLGILPEEMLYLFVGQIIYEKNIELIINALEKIKHTNFKMVFAGAGYAEKTFQKKVKSLNISDKVQFVGLITDRQHLADLYAAADLFIFPSLYDTSAIVVREAATFATPSIIIRNSMVSEIIHDNENGFLIENSVLSLAEKLLFLQNEKDNLLQVGKAAQATFNRTWTEVTAEVTDRYASLIKRKKIR
ncbi:MAG: glycosyltransferase [Paludibacter sp.]|nr:glycosyltransferase [Paludibacter sp.]